MSYQYLTQATETLEVAGLGHKHLADFTFPPLQQGEQPDGTPYRLAAFGDTQAAETIIFTDMPHSNTLASSNMMLRLSVQQLALGENCAIVGVETYNPTARVLQFNKKQRKQVAHGDFRPLSDRFFAAMDKVAVEDDQRVVVYGYSKGADVGIEVAHENETNPNRGRYKIASLGAFELARSAYRSLGMIPVFATSGNDLWDNVLASDSPALLEARFIPGNVHELNKSDKKAHDKEVTKGVMGYTRADIWGNLALIRGFGHARSIKQLAELSVPTVVGVMNDSPIVAKSARRKLAELNKQENFEVVTLDGLDHSAADNLRYSSAFMLHTVAAAA